MNKILGHNKCICKSNAFSLNFLLKSLFFSFKPDSEKDVQEAKAMTVGASSWVNSISQTLQLQSMEAMSEPALDSVPF